MHHLKAELLERFRSEPTVFEFLQSRLLDGIWYQDLRDQQSEWSSARFWETLGYDTPEAKTPGMRWLDAVHEDDRHVFQENLDLHLENPNHPCDQIIRMKHRDGTAIWGRCRGMVLRDENGHPTRLLGVNTDLSSLKEVEATRIHSGQISAIGHLVGLIASDVEVPTREVLNNVQDLKSHMQDIADVLADRQEESALQHLLQRAQPLVDACETELRRVERTISGLLKNTAAGVNGSPAVVDVNHLIETACALTEVETEARACLIKSLGDVPKIAGNSARLSQAFVAFLLHAARSVEPGQAGENRITIRSWTDETAVHVSFRNTGPALGVREQARIFSHDYVTDSDGVRAGAGLTTCAEVASEHGGSISIESEPGLGTTLVLSLPYGQIIAGGLPDKPEPIHILVVDDEPLLLKAFARILSRWQVTTAANGREALDLITQGNHYDLVLCDMVMPELDGPGLYAELRRLEHPLVERIQFVSGAAGTPEVDSFASEHQVTVLHKPIAAKQLITAVIDRFNETSRPS